MPELSALLGEPVTGAEQDETPAEDDDVEQNKTPLTAQPGSAPAPERKPAEKPLRRVGSLTLGACLIAAGVFFLLYFFVPGFDVQLTLKIARRWRWFCWDARCCSLPPAPAAGSTICVRAGLSGADGGLHCMAMLPLLWDELSGENQQTMNRLSTQAIDELYSACKQDAQDIAIQNISGWLYLNGAKAETLQQAAALPAGDTCLTLTVELFGPYDSAADFARDCYTLTALAKQCTVPPEKLHFTWDARSPDKKRDVLRTDRTVVRSNVRRYLRRRRTS